MLPTAPGPNPLQGATLLRRRPAPRRGRRRDRAADRARPEPVLRQLLVAAFRPRARPAAPPRASSGAQRRVARKVALLEKIADQPESQRISSYSEGGGPGGDLRPDAEDLLSQQDRRPRLDPRVHHLLPARQPRRLRHSAEVQAAGPDFRRRIDEMAAGDRQPPGGVPARGRRDRVLELHVQRRARWACGRPICATRSTRIASLPHTVVYLEAGYSDANSAALHRPRAQRVRRPADPRLLHQ